MKVAEEDCWVREFDVSNPQKTHAGYTVYRISSKVFPKHCSEPTSEVIVFKRYSEIRGLYKELKTIYESKNVGKNKFPRFAKGHYFDRFDESVIEERQKQTLSMLLFAQNIPWLFTSDPFIKFFEGGIEHKAQSTRIVNDFKPSNDMNAPSQAWTSEMYQSDMEESNSDDDTCETLFKKLSITPDEDEKQWLTKAMSLCSEGDDIECLASQATSSITDFHIDNDESVGILPTLLENEINEDVFVINDSPSHSLNQNCKENSDNNHHLVEISNNPEISTLDPDLSEESIGISRSDPSDPVNKIFTDNQDYNFELLCPEINDNIESKEQLSDDKLEKEVDCHDGLESLNVEDDSQDLRNNTSKHFVRRISNIAMSWIDPKKKDYLYDAAQIIQEALYYEANELYADAFNKYKICVGVLLNGVQYDNEVNRREAVRRKTAQYLLKAEFLFNTYLKLDKNEVIEDSRASMITSQELHDFIDIKYASVSLKDIKVIGVLGKNMLVECFGLGEVNVIKVLPKTNALHHTNKQESQETIREGFSRKYVKSKWMVQLYRHFETTSSIFLVLEYASGGCLWNQLNCLQRPQGSYSSQNVSKDQISHVCHPRKEVTSRDKYVQQCIAELLLAIDHLHSFGIILKDLKPSNILLNENGRIRLSYFGVWDEVDHSVDPDAIRHLYCAPEISLGEKITVAADWWSLGVLSYEMITAKTLSSTQPWGIYPHSSLQFPAYQDISLEARSFLSGLICYDPRERLGSAIDGVEAVRSHAFLQDVDWDRLMNSSY